MSTSVLSYQQRILKEILKNYHFSGQEILLDAGCGNDPSLDSF